MDLDDLPVGRVLTRREALAVLGASGALFLLGCSDSEATTDPSETGACVVRPELTEGPYYVDEELNRSDLRADPSDGSVRHGSAAGADLQRVAGRRQRLRAPGRRASWTSGTATPRGSTRTCRTAASTRWARSSCAAIRSPTATASRSSPRSIRAGTGAARCTSTSRSAPARRPPRRTSSPRSSSSTTR